MLVWPAHLKYHRMYGSMLERICGAEAAESSGRHRRRIEHLMPCFANDPIFGVAFITHHRLHNTMAHIIA